MFSAMKCSIARILAVALLACSGVRAAESGTFVHPGLLHSRADLDRMRDRVAAGDEPWKSGFAKLRDHAQSQSNWKLRGPLETVTRGGASPGNAQMFLDGN